jgi:UDPglucose 6-dehydrogenase
LRIAVAGIGQVGLSLALLLAQRHQVTALDIDQRKVALVNDRICPIADGEMQDWFAHRSINLRATLSEQEAYSGADAVFIATPTDYDPEHNRFDTSSVEHVLAAAMSMSARAVLVIKSTVPVGFTAAMREHHQTDRIVFSPEFLREGRALYDSQHPSRIVVGDRCARGRFVASLLLEGSARSDVPVLLTASTEAEAIKLFANTYLAMRVAFFNELDTFAATHALDTLQIIEGACSDPRIGGGYNNPSFGYGGYCLPKDTRQLLANYGDVPQNLMHAVVQANATRKDFISSDVLRKHPKLVGVYRLGMKAGSQNFRDSSVLGVMRRLREQGVEVIVYEPALEAAEFCGCRVVSDLAAFKAGSDLILANRLTTDLSDVMGKVYSRDLYGGDG